MLEAAFGSREPEDALPRRGSRSTNPMTRILLALALIAACTTAPPDPPAAAAEDAVTYRVLDTGAYGVAATAEAGSARDARVLVASSAGEFAALWRETVGDAPLPPVDFARESAVFLLLGQRTTGGWSVEPAGVAVDGDSVDVTAAIGRPAPGGITTMAFTAPFAVIAVGKPGLERAVWKDRDGSVVASAVETPR
jgi:hypothetical protein